MKETDVSKLFAQVSTKEEKLWWHLRTEAFKGKSVTLCHCLERSEKIRGEALSLESFWAQPSIYKNKF